MRSDLLVFVLHDFTTGQTSLMLAPGLDTPRPMTEASCLKISVLGQKRNFLGLDLSHLCLKQFEFIDAQGDPKLICFDRISASQSRSV